MFNLLTLAFGVFAIIGLAKLNKSNKLFWTLLVSMLIGFASGSFVGKFNSVGNKKVGTTTIAPMHDSSALTIFYDAALPMETLVTSSPAHAGQSFVDHIDMVPTTTLLAYNPEDDIGNVDTENTS